MKREHGTGLDVPFATLTEAAARVIESLPFPRHFPVTVLFDSYYLCANVARAMENKGWHYIGVAKSNRRLTIDGRSHRMSRYAGDVVRLAAGNG